MRNKLVAAVAALGLIVGAFFLGRITFDPQVVTESVAYTPDECVNALVNAGELIEKMQEALELMAELDAATNIIDVLRLNAQIGAFAEEVRGIRAQYDSDLVACDSVEGKITI